MCWPNHFSFHNVGKPRLTVLGKRFCWTTVTPIPLHNCYYPTLAELSIKTETIWSTKPNIFTIWLFHRKNVLIHVLGIQLNYISLKLLWQFGNSPFLLLELNTKDLTEDSKGLGKDTVPRWEREQSGIEQTHTATQHCSKTCARNRT